LYESYFGLVERPFSIAPDPQYLYMSTRHKEAMAHLSYGLSQGGCFIVLTGEVGTGKTTLCRNLLNDLPENVDIALILNANINEQELLQTICDELSVTYPPNASQKVLSDLINQHLLNTFAANRHTVLIIDEAQILSRDVLEQIRLLTNLETNKAKLLQIILIGQPELNQLLTRNDLRQLAQRVTARYHLAALERSEMEDYVNYRLSVAGCKRPVFTKQALNKIHSATGGIPRRINVLADHALLSAYSLNQNTVDAKVVKKASKDVFIEQTQDALPKYANMKWLVIFGMGLLCVNLLLWWWFAKGEQAISESHSVTIEATNSSKVQAILEDATLLSDKSLSRSDDLKQDADKAVSVVNEVDGSQALKPKELEQTVKSLELVNDSSLSDEQSEGSFSLVSESQSIKTDVVEQVEKQTIPAPKTTSEQAIKTGAEQAIPKGKVQFLEQEIELTSEELQTTELSIDGNQALDDGRLVRLLETAADQTGRFQSFRRLASVWQSELPDKIIRPICDIIQEQQLACLPLYFWHQIERYNRPAILILEHNQKLHRVVLTQVFGNEATLYIGNSVYTVILSEVRRLWNKKGMIFWRPTDIGNPFYQLGNQSSDIVWLRWYLNQALFSVNLPVLENTTNPIFDLDMSQKVFALQTGFKITPDSKVGDETYLLMNELVSPDSTPLLIRRKL